MNNLAIHLARRERAPVVTRREALYAASVVLLGAVASGLLPGGSPALAQPRRATVTVVNRSKWEIHHLFLSPTDTEEWGPDQMGEDILESEGGRFQLTNIPCDSYDIRLVDEDGDECIIREVDICADTASWVITDKVLLGCEEESASRTRCPTASRSTAPA